VLSFLVVLIICHIHSLVMGVIEISSTNYIIYCRSGKLFAYAPKFLPVHNFTDLIARALPFAIMDDNVARTSLASCGTRRIRANDFRRLHWLWCTLLHKHIGPSSRHRIAGSSRTCLIGTKLL
jgi:hypothetical protein